MEQAASLEGSQERRKAPPPPGTFEGELVIVEWSFATSKSIILCNSNGVALSDHPLRMNGHGINFTAYLNSAWFEGKDLPEIEALTLSPEFAPIDAMVVARIKAHLQERTKQTELDIIERWKAEDVYPYKESPTTIDETIEQSVFAACAVQLHQSLPEFAKSPAKSQKLSLLLIREAMETNPDALKVILDEVLGLTIEQQNDFAELIQETKLATIIKASRVIADRLKFLDALDVLLFEPESKRTWKERSQLHKLLERHPWVFGEEFSLSISDRHLTRALERHIGLLGRDTTNLEAVAAIEGGDPGIIDLMVTKTIQRREDELEHLIIELKRPSQPINGEVLEQVRKYALAVAKDDRFHAGKVKWKVWAVSNKLSDEVLAESRQKDKPVGLARDYSAPDVQIWVKTWGEILDECRSRLKFYQEQLDYQPNKEAALDYVRSINPGFLPVHLQTRQDTPSLACDPEGDTA